jgi:superfamily II DNA or RNA helicase
MSSFRDIDFRLTYQSGTKASDVMQEFYIPVLGLTKNYDRVAGYFSSATFANSARGVAGLVRNGGRMRMVTSHAFTFSDVDVLQDFFNSPELAENLISSFKESFLKMGNLADTMERNHIEAMCWMLKENILEIKVVIPKSADLRKLSPDELEKFHPKFGIFEDHAGNQLCFAGSINETASAWSKNIENFSVFPSWIPGRSDYIPDHKRMFSDYWRGINDENWITLDLPAAVKEKLVEDYAPADFPAGLDSPKPKVPAYLRSYQREAVDAWIKNNCKGILEMATGTGKTRTAKECIAYSLSQGKTLTLVVVPYQHIGEQWMKELKDFDPIFITGNWRNRLDDLSLDVTLGRRRNVTLVAVKNTASKSDFVNLLEGMHQEFDHVLFIGDEVHWLGARTFSPALIDFADYRLGLSATPNRYFDEEGTDLLFDYFDSIVYELPISKALTLKDEKGMPILCPYSYHPILVTLSDEELEAYREFTQKIMKLRNLESTREIEEQIQTLQILRAGVAKSAKSKIPALATLLDDLKKPVNQALIYCVDTIQVQQAAEVLNKFGIHTQQITGDESARALQKNNYVSERDLIIGNFAAGNLDVLLSMECLDEGVDIPSARIGIIMASSGNPKEFIQRRGRLMRPFAGKDIAEIYDFCVLPESSEVSSHSGNLLRVELKRMEEFASDSVNPQETFNIVKKVIG